MGMGKVQKYPYFYPLEMFLGPWNSFKNYNFKFKNYMWSAKILADLGKMVGFLKYILWIS